MKVDGVSYRSIFASDDGATVRIVDQTVLPHEFRIVCLQDLDAVARAIADMQVRGAPLIGATAAYGLALALRKDPSDAALASATRLLAATRPTAVNLLWGLEGVTAAVERLPNTDRAEAAWKVATEIADADVECNRRIGVHGLELIREVAERNAGRPVEILTHCNAGWLATVDWGTATAPIYMAHEEGIPLHIWVDETRPRNQGASLTAWELGHHGVPHTVVVDNAGGHLMHRGRVDLCLVGTDRTTSRGDVANKIGTYLKALAARDNGIPFYVAAPSSSIDWALEDGGDIPIEERAEEEVRRISGRTDEGAVRSVTVVPPMSAVANPAFDVTPARLVTALVTERGVVQASRDELLALFPERAGEVRRHRPAERQGETNA